MECSPEDLCRGGIEWHHTATVGPIPSVHEGFLTVPSGSEVARHLEHAARRLLEQRAACSIDFELDGTTPLQDFIGLHEVALYGLWHYDPRAVWAVFLHPVPGEVDAAVQALLGLVHAQHQVRPQVHSLTGVPTAVGTLNVHQLTDSHVNLQTA